MMRGDLSQFLLLRTVQTCCRFTIEVTLFILSEASLPLDPRALPSLSTSPFLPTGGVGGDLICPSDPHHPSVRACYWLRLTRGAN